MSKARTIMFSIVGMICLAMSSAMAHHSITPHFDSDKPVSFTGVVTNFRFVNPHAFIYVDVEDEDGNVNNWNCEMQAAVILRHSGWTNDLFEPGDTVKINGNAARRDPYGCAFVSAELEDGTEVRRGGQIVSAVDGRSTPGTSALNDPTAPDEKTLFGSWRTAPHFRANGDLHGDLVTVHEGDPLPSQEDIGTEENPLGIYASYLTEAGLTAAQEFELVFDDPALFCSGASIFRAAKEPNGISEVSQVENKIIFKNQYMDVVRTIHMDRQAHPENIEPSMEGHSYGWFEDEDLIIETSGFAAGVMFPHPGVLHSDQMRVRERISLSDDGTQLINEYVATDPVYFSKPIPGKIVWNRSDRPLMTFDCIELSGTNNERPEQ